VTERDLERLTEAGVYGPSQDDAAEQRQLLARLLAQGLTVDELTSAHRLGNLVLRSFRHLIQPGELLTLDDVVASSGLAPDLVLRVRRAWGFPDPATGEPCFSRADAEALAFIHGLSEVVGPDVMLQLARAVGTAMSRVAEAEIAVVRSQLEAPAQARRQSGASVLLGYARALESFLPGLLRATDAVHRAQLVHVGRRYVDWALPPSALNVVDMVVGFADLTGSTALVQRADLAGLDRALTRFEETTSDLIARAGATLVKRLGDGVMFVAPQAEVAFGLALDIVAAFPAGRDTPPARVGLAVGHVVALRGDFYGPAVHLAARLADAAPAATVFAAPELRARAAQSVADFTFHSRGTAALAGFDAPISLYEIRRAGTA
jgi:adenylate cyclase